MTKIGTLAELNVKPGDVVEFVPTGSHHTVLCCKRIADTTGEPINYSLSWDCVKTFSIVSRAPDKFRIVSRAPDKPKLWRDMTPEEKGALLLAHHEGKVIQSNHTVDHNYDDWNDCCPVWCPDAAYRIAPEPKVETVNLYSNDCAYGRLIEAMRGHRITFNLIDGEPDCTSVKMEKL